MNAADFGDWQPMSTAPKDGTRVLVAVKASEQGPAEVDVARWARPERSGEECWIAADSDPSAVIVYSEAELLSWMPLPTPAPKLRPKRASARAHSDEIGGSGI